MPAASRQPLLVYLILGKHGGAKLEKDPETAAIEGVRELLEPLLPDARARVLGWAEARYGAQRAQIKHLTSQVVSRAGTTDPASYPNFAALFDAASAATEGDQALVGGYWFQVVQGQSDFTSQPINTELKNVGHPVSNITRAFDVLSEQKPALARQVHKSGTARQGRKRYMITAAGIKRVEALIRGEGAA